MGVRGIVLKAARWVVWILLAWLVVRGAASIVAPPAPVITHAAVPTDTQTVDREAPGAFAALFAREYLTWTAGKESDRALRLRPLLAGKLDAQAGWQAGASAADQVAEAAWPFRLTAAGENRWLVTVVARVTTRTEKAATPRTLYLAVPVTTAAGGFLVYDYPTIVPAPPAANVDEPALVGEEITDSDGQVRAMLAGFFRAYAVGSGTDVTYFLEPGLRGSGLGGALTYKEIVELNLRRSTTGTWATAVVVFEDPVSGSLSRQRYTMAIVERDARWYIKQIIQKGA